MQTTLLGLAIAFILALLTALIGPSFFDWTQFRPRFEAEATRLLGTQVRVAGTMDARLLPIPSLRLQAVSIGGANDPGRLSADRFDVEFSLGALMRGEVRATDLTINGFSVDLGLDDRGQIDWPGLAQVDLRTLAIEKLNLTGRIALHDAASKSTVELRDIAFAGDIRGTAGALRGDGNFTLSDARMPFRISASSPPDQAGMRTRLTVDANAIPLSIDLDGLVTLDARRPRFDGTLTLARGARANSADPLPLRAITKLKADPSGAALDQIDVTAGADDSALKFTGSGDMRFGALPFLRATLTAKSLDGDRMLGRTGSVAALLPGLGDALAALPRVPFAADVTTSIDQIMLAGRPVQDIGVELRTAGHGWSVSRLDFRGPGATRVALAGAFSAGQTQFPTPGFDGRLNLVSADPDAFADWLQGKGETAPRMRKPLKLAGALKLAPGRIALDGMNAEIDGGALRGRFLLARPEKGPSQIEAALQADRLDLDSIIALLKTAGTSRDGWPDEGQIALDIGSAVAAGQEMKPFAAALAYDDNRITLERLRVGEASGVMLDGSGLFDRKTATGTLSLTATTPMLGRLANLVQPFAPDLAGRLTRPAKDDGPSRLALNVGLESDPSKSDRIKARGSLGIETSGLQGTLTVNASPQASALRAFDVDKLRRTEVTADGKLSSQRGRELVTLLGLDRVITVGETPLAFEMNAGGAWSSSWRGNAKLTGPALDAEVQGTLEPSNEPHAAELRVTLRKVNIAPLLDIPADDPIARDLSLTSRLSAAGDRYTLDGIDGLFGGARIRGRLVVTRQDVNAIDGELGIDRLDLAPLFALAIGSRGHVASAPLGTGWLRGWQGRLGFVALRGVLPGGLEVQSLSGALRNDAEALKLEGAKAKIGGGDATGDAEARFGAAGLALSGELHLAGVETDALNYRGLALPAGRVTSRLSLSSQGRSASALSVAVAGEGLATLAPLRLNGLDPKAIDLAIVASDQAKIVNDTALRRLVEPALAAGSLMLETAQFPFVIKDSRLRINSTLLETPNARAVVSGGFDFTADQADYRATLTALNQTGPGNSFPELQVFAAGPPDRMARTVDIAPLSSWLAIRAIDRETRRLEALERMSPPSIAAIPSDAPVGPSPADSKSGAPKSTEPTSVEPTAMPADSSPVPSPLPRPKAQRVMPSQASTQPALAPALPPAIEVGPPPGIPRTPRLRPPMPLAPPAQRPGL